MLALIDAGMRCIAFDRRGHGRPDDPGGGYDFDTLADDLASVLDQLHLRQAVLWRIGLAEADMLLEDCAMARSPSA